MELSPTKLALKLEALCVAGRALVAETSTELVVANLAAANAIALVAALQELGWRLSVEDATPEVIPAADISEAYEPYRITVSKPATPDGVSLALSRVGLQGWLADPGRTPLLWVASLEQPVQTLAGRLGPWSDANVGDVLPTGCDPRKVVRDLTRDGRVASSIDPWILSDPETDLPWAHWAFTSWAGAASAELLRALSDEVEEDARLVFRGPPLIRLQVEADILGSLGDQGFRNLQRAAAWVFESPTEMRPRHDLFAPEIARTAPAGQTAGEVFRRAAGSALEGARIARAFGLAEQSRDSLKAMTDLRKAIGEEIGKLSETTRQIAAAVAAALFAGIALIAARLVIADPDPAVKVAAAVIGLVLFLYVAAVIASGVQYVSLQRRLRTEWHAKIYRFIPDGDYQAMVVRPAASAELGFAIAAWVGSIAAALLLILVFLAAFGDFPAAPYEPGSELSAPEAVGDKAADTAAKGSTITTLDTEPAKATNAASPAGSRAPTKPSGGASSTSARHARQGDDAKLERLQPLKSSGTRGS